jgi:hypothetical protein
MPVRIKLPGDNQGDQQYFKQFAAAGKNYQAALFVCKIKGICLNQ